MYLRKILGLAGSIHRCTVGYSIKSVLDRPTRSLKKDYGTVHSVPCWISDKKKIIVQIIAMDSATKYIIFCVFPKIFNMLNRNKLKIERSKLFVRCGCA